MRVHDTLATNDIDLSPPMRIQDLPLDVRRLSWCFCGFCGPTNEELSGRWEAIAEHSAALLAMALPRRSESMITWASSFMYAPADLAVALHRQLVADIRRLAAHERRSAKKVCAR